MKAHISGGGLTKAQRKAMDAEINRQIVEADKKYSTEVDAVVLYTLHTELGFGKARLRKFWEALYRNHQDMVERYEMEDAFPWWCTEQLKKLGVDVEEWNKEIIHNNK